MIGWLAQRQREIDVVGVVGVVVDDADVEGLRRTAIGEGDRQVADRDIVFVTHAACRAIGRVDDHLHLLVGAAGPGQRNGERAGVFGDHQRIAGIVELEFDRADFDFTNRDVGRLLRTQIPDGHAAEQQGEIFVFLVGGVVDDAHVDLRGGGHTRGKVDRRRHGRRVVVGGVSRPFLRADRHAAQGLADVAISAQHELQRGVVLVDGQAGVGEFHGREACEFIGARVAHDRIGHVVGAVGRRCTALVAGGPDGVAQVDCRAADEQAMRGCRTAIVSQIGIDHDRTSASNFRISALGEAATHVAGQVGS